MYGDVPWCDQTFVFRERIVESALPVNDLFLTLFSYSKEVDF